MPEKCSVSDCHKPATGEARWTDMLDEAPYWCAYCTEHLALCSEQGLPLRSMRLRFIRGGLEGA